MEGMRQGGRGDGRGRGKLWCQVPAAESRETVEVGNESESDSEGGNDESAGLVRSPHMALPVTSSGIISAISPVATSAAPRASVIACPAAESARPLEPPCAQAAWQ